MRKTMSYKIDEVAVPIEEFVIPRVDIRRVVLRLVGENLLYHWHVGREICPHCGNISACDRSKRRDIEYEKSLSWIPRNKDGKCLMPAEFFRKSAIEAASLLKSGG